ncbi:MAG: DNA polymerase III subunit delta [Candidatus Uhrbacteria bacterium]
MLILVYGDDTFRAQEKVSKLREAFLEKHDKAGFNLAEFASTDKPGEILQAVSSLPFMGSKRMVVIRDLVATTKADAKDQWASLANTPDSSVVVLWETLEPKALEKKPLFALLSKGVDVHLYACPLLEGSALSRWASDRAKELGGLIAPDALRELCDRVGGDLWQMDGEIEKLVAYSSGRTIAVADVDLLVRATFDGEIFALVDAISRKESAKAIRLLEEERLAGGSDFAIFGMLARQVRILLGARALLDEDPRASSQRLASEMEINPFVAQKAIDQARKFTLDDLRATHDLLFRYDAGMKSGVLDAELAVDLVTTKLIS